MADVPVEYYNQDKHNQVKIKGKWWLEPEAELHQHVFGVVTRILENQRYRYEENLRYARLYANRDLKGLLAGSYSRVQQSIDYGVTFNVIKSCIDTVSAKIAKSKPRPMFLTSGGDSAKQTRAKKLTKFFDGWFDKAKVYQTTRLSFRDGAVSGLGGVKLYEEDDQIKIERTIGSEIVVDDTEGFYGDPRQLHQYKYVPRDVLLDMYPKFVQEILSATAKMPGDDHSLSEADMVCVVESWHLPSSAKATDGKHAICIENATLFHETWKKPRYPFVFWRWNQALFGFYGQGLAEELYGIQLEIAKLLADIKEAQHLVARPRVWLDIANAAATPELTNEIGGKNYYAGQPPVFQTATAMNPEIYQHLENLYQKAYEITGVSQMSANSQKPSGVTAGVAMRTLQDIESERFMITGQAWEEFHMDICDLSLDMHADLAGKGKKLSIKVRNGKGLEEIKWKDAVMDREDLDLRVFPTSILPTQPAAKMQTVQEWTEAGWVGKEDAMDMLDFPDTEKYVSQVTASKKLVQKYLDAIIEEGEYNTPEPYLNLQMAITMGQNEYLKAKFDGVDEDRQQLLRNFIDDCQQLVDAMAPPPEMSPMQPAIDEMAAMGAPPPMPAADPMAMDPSLQQDALIA